MTRKRFVKLVIEKGYDRFITAYTNFLLGITDRGWEIFKRWFETIENMLEEQVEKK